MDVIKAKWNKGRKFQQSAQTTYKREKTKHMTIRVKRDAKDVEEDENMDGRTVQPRRLSAESVAKRDIMQ